MTLTSEEIVTIMEEVVAGKPLSVNNPEAIRFRRDIEQDIRAMDAVNVVADPPAEWPKITPKEKPDA